MPSSSRKADPASATLALPRDLRRRLHRPPHRLRTLFGHFGDRIGRKTTLVIALATMGLSTFAIGALPYAKPSASAAPLLLSPLPLRPGHRPRWRVGRSRPPRHRKRSPQRRAWYGMFPSSEPRIGFFLSERRLPPPLPLRSPTSSSSPTAGASRSSPAPSWFFSVSTSASPSPKPLSSPKSAQAANEQVTKSPSSTVFRDHTRTLAAGGILTLRSPPSSSSTS